MTTLRDVANSGEKKTISARKPGYSPSDFSFGKAFRGRMRRAGEGAGGAEERWVGAGCRHVIPSTKLAGSAPVCPSSAERVSISEEVTNPCSTGDERQSRAGSSGIDDCSFSRGVEAQARLPELDRRVDGAAGEAAARPDQRQGPHGALRIAGRHASPQPRRRSWMESANISEICQTFASLC